MDWEQLKRNPLTWIAGVGLVLFFMNRASSSPIPKIPTNPAPNPTNPPGTPGCAYKSSGNGFPKTQTEKIARVKSYILAYNAGVERTAFGLGFIGSDYAGILASALVSKSALYGIPLDILVAVCKRESSFNYWLFDSYVKSQINKGGAIGPMQVKPAAFQQVGMDPQSLIGWEPHSNRIYYAVAAGAKYLLWIKNQMPDRPWCDVLHAYYCGVTGFLKNGCRNDSYVNQIVAWANQYTDLKG